MRLQIGLFIALLIPALPRGHAAAKGLPEADREAREATEDYLESSRARYRELERLKKDIRYISETIDREFILDKKRSLAAYSQSVLARIAELRRSGNIHPKLNPLLQQLENLFRDVPERHFAEPYASGLVKFIAHELRWTADNAKTETELLRLLRRRLALPDEVDAAGWLKTDVSISEFIAQGVIKLFLAKHRLKRPETHVVTTAEDIVGNKHNVQIGVDVTGTVVHHNKFSIDGDKTFDIGDLHIELTPEWRIAHPKLPIPVTGQRIRVRGWTYFDMFHKVEEEYNPDDPVLGAGRASQWEIHPVQDIEILPSE